VNLIEIQILNNNKMKTATQNLEDDHVHILKLTDVMEKIAQSKDLDIDHIGEVIGLVRNFADGLHHAKEENLFFPKLAEKGFSQQQGPVAVMLHEHVEGRNYIKAVADSLPLYNKGDKSVREEISQNILGYVSLLRNHIAKENNILFRMADNVLSDPEQQKLLSEFESATIKAGTAEGPQDYIRQIERLALLYKV
jgi:hemerythrin-like domain-containing protein